MLYTDGGDGYVKYGTVDFCPSAKLTDPIGETDLTFDIDSLESFTDVNANTWFQLNDELLEFVSYSAPTLTVRRGLLDTVPMAHSAGMYYSSGMNFPKGIESPMLLVIGCLLSYPLLLVLVSSLTLVHRIRILRWSAGQMLLTLLRTSC